MYLFSFGNSNYMLWVNVGDAPLFGDKKLNKKKYLMWHQKEKNNNSSFITFPDRSSPAFLARIL